MIKEVSIIATLKSGETIAALIQKPMKQSFFNAGIAGVAAIALTLASCAIQAEQAETTPASEAAVPELAPAIPAEQTEAKATAPTSQSEAAAAKPTPSFVATPPASEVVPSDAKEAAATLTDAPLPTVVQSYSGDELFAAGGGGCGMSLWRADSSYNDGSILFSGIGEGPQLLMKLENKFVTFERMEGSGKEFYGQFAQQRFRNLNGDIEVMTEVELGATGEIESVEIDKGRVVVTRNGASQEITVKGDAGC